MILNNETAYNTDDLYEIARAAGIGGKNLSGLTIRVQYFSPSASVDTYMQSAYDMPALVKFERNGDGGREDDYELKVIPPHMLQKCACGSPMEQFAVAGGVVPRNLIRQIGWRFSAILYNSGMPRDKTINYVGKYRMRIIDEKISELSLRLRFEKDVDVQARKEQYHKDQASERLVVDTTRCVGHIAAFAGNIEMHKKLIAENEQKIQAYILRLQRTRDSDGFAEALQKAIHNEGQQAWEACQTQLKASGLVLVDN
jgi:hypothetical protein